MKWIDQEFQNGPELLEDVRLEHIRQIKKWGVQVQTPFEWLAFLTEEVGELNEAVTEHCFRDASRDAIYDEAIQVATLALKVAEMSRYGVSVL